MAYYIDYHAPPQSVVPIIEAAIAQDTDPYASNNGVWTTIEYRGSSAYTLWTIGNSAPLSWASGAHIKIDIPSLGLAGLPAVSMHGLDAVRLIKLGTESPYYITLTNQADRVDSSVFVSSSGRFDRYLTYIDGEAGVDTLNLTGLGSQSNYRITKIATDIYTVLQISSGVRLQIRNFEQIQFTNSSPISLSTFDNQDLTPPTIALSSNLTELKSTETAVVSMALSEASTDFTLSDLTVIGGSLSNFSGSGTAYSATFTPNPGFNSTALITVASSRFSDSAGNFNADGSDDNNRLAINVSLPISPDDSSDPVPPKQIKASNRDDTLTGTSADDLINGKKGNDTLTGLDGRDIFQFSAKLSATTNVDTITDFQPGEDSIQLAAKIFKGINTTNLEDRFFEDSVETGSGAALVYRDGVLAYDPDGVGPRQAIDFVRLTGIPEISADDLLVS